MRLYPAIRASMGDWSYYIVRMKMSEVAQEVKFAHDIHEDQTLGEAIQRKLNDKRVRSHIVSFLQNRDDRFFSSIVVAAFEGEPHWHSTTFDPSMVPSVFTDTRSLRDSCGILSFGDEPRYYALDGQHRVAAIKHLLSPDAGLSLPDGFENDMLSVIVVLREEHNVSAEEWLRRYRRLFSSLNRYAKPTDKDTNIIMDEDDAIAILTRRLISDHDFFKAPGKHRDSFRVLTKGRTLREGTSHFTTLQVLYDLNETLLKTKDRANNGWFEDSDSPLDKQARPEEEWLEDRYGELAAYWDALTQSLPILGASPPGMRCHNPDDDPERGNTQDNFLFWPIGQLAFMKVVRSRLDAQFRNGHGSVEEMARALRPFAEVPWILHGSPWRGLMLVRTEGKDGTMKWRMRSEDRKKAIEVASRLVAWMSGVDPLNDDELATLRRDWKRRLYPEEPSEEECERMWAKVVEACDRARTATAA